MAKTPSGKSSEVTRLKEGIDLLGSVAKYGTFLVGGTCLLLYSKEIGRFPEGVGLGEGLAFYLVCAGFLVAYGIYTLFCLAGGAIVLVWPVRYLQQRIKKRDKDFQERHRWLVRTDFSVVLDPMFLFIGIVSLALHVVYAYLQPPGVWYGWLFLLVPMVQATGFFLFLVISRRYRHVESGLITDEDLHAPGVSRRDDLIVARRVLLVWLILAPMIVMPDRLFLVKTAFQLAQLRKDNATVHVKAPWTKRLEQPAFIGAESFLGDEHRRFERVNVLLRSVGDSVVIELPSASKRASLAIPKEAVYVE